MDDAQSNKVTYLSLPLLELSAEREFPGPVFLCLQHKMVRFRHKGDRFEAAEFNKLVFNRVKFVFIEETDRDAFKSWVTESDEAEQKATAEIETAETKPIIEAAADTRRAMMDIFENPKQDKVVHEAVNLSKKLVTEFLRKPFAINNISALQKYAKGAVDHSVNVAVLSVFLGLRMGYTHQLILENLAMGGLFHDIGKLLVEPAGEGLTDENDAAMQQHPKLGHELLEKTKEISNEVRMIVAQHHELLDGSGYPAKLKGLAVYDLARLVAIANVYDNLVSQSKATSMRDRAREALDKLEAEYADKLDQKKLEKVIKILDYSFP